MDLDRWLNCPGGEESLGGWRWIASKGRRNRWTGTVLGLDKWGSRHPLYSRPGRDVQLLLGLSADSRKFNIIDKLCLSSGVDASGDGHQDCHGFGGLKKPRLREISGEGSGGIDALLLDSRGKGAHLGGDGESLGLFSSGGRIQRTTTT